MAIILTQTDNAADSGASAGCSGETLAGTPVSREATEGGTAGSTEFMSSIASGSTVATCMFQSDVDTGEPAPTTWDAGDYVVRLNVTTAQNDLTWTATYVCERTSGGVFNTVASLTGQSTDMTTVGVKTQTVNRATDFTPADADSTLYVVCVMTNAHSHTGRSIGITPDQNLDTPIEVAGVTESIAGTSAGTSSDTAAQTDTASLSATGAGTSTDSAPIVATAALTGTGAGASTDTGATTATASLTATGAGTSTDTIAAATIAESISGTSTGTSSDSADAGVEPPIRVLTVRFRPAGWTPA